MKKNCIFSSAIAMLIMTILTTNLTAQVYVPSGQPLNHSQSGYGILINTTNNIHFDTPNIPNIKTGIGINGNTTTYGSRMAIGFRTTSNGTTGQSKGVARGNIGFASDWNANGAIMGVSGNVDSVDILNVTQSNKVSSALGGNFSVRVFDPIQSANTGSYLIAGVRSVLDGNISTYPNTGVVAAMMAEDRIKGSQTWAGHFDGRGYFSDKVGIKTLNPASDLSVNGNGNSLYTSYFYTNSATAGNRAVFAEAAQPTGFAEHIIASTGLIESGFGYATGVQGVATTDNPSNAGRAYGVRGEAGNATDGANYGVYGMLRGSNGGTGVFGYDAVNFFNQQNELMPAGTTWAGYFLGNSYFSNKVNVGTHNMPAMTTLGGKDYLMYVGGGGLFEEVKVLTGWADYVFSEEYELISLENVAIHIQENGYLHNTPSALEIEENGLELGAITLNQQEKIEELYLHLIEMNKTVKALQIQNEALIEKVTLLEKR